MADVYATITEADPALVSRIAEVLELRAADPQQQAMRQTYLGDIQFPQGARVLDVGCGTGAVTRELATWPDVAEVVGVDPSPTFLASARALDPSANARFVEGDTRALGFQDGSVDAVVFHTTLCHVPGPELALREAARVLRPGGWLAIFDGDYATTTGSELAAIQAELAAHPARLVVLDPLDLAAAGASGSNLYDMGAVLQAIQGVCQHAGCALLVVTHWNKTGDGRDADRISGAGPAAWARVICSVSVDHRASDDDGASKVLLGVELIGGEIPDTRFRIRRRVHADDPADLGSPLSYAVEVLATEDDQDLDPAAAALSKSRQWVLTALRAGGELQTVKQLGDRLAQAGHPLKPRTIQTALGELEAAGLAQGSEEGNGRARYWSPATTPHDGTGGGVGTP